ncbi:hypothetical protein PV325_013768, partial [Microctonus aethiopoides]
MWKVEIYRSRGIPDYNDVEVVIWVQTLAGIVKSRDLKMGAGFSYVDDDSAYATDNHQIAEDLVRCMHGFLAKIPEFKKVPTYIVGESYGGKMAAEFALLWYKHQQNGTIISNLKGVAFGDSWISPITIVGSWAPFLLNT